jgi:hypothetical protein
MNPNILERFWKNIQISNFMNIRTVAAKLLHVDRHPEAKSGISKNYHRET